MQSAFRLPVMPIMFLASQVVSKTAQQTCLHSLPHYTFIGLTEISSYNPSAIISRSIELGEPIIYVSMNYRCVNLASALHT
jgi:hypothetical protein